MASANGKLLIKVIECRDLRKVVTPLNVTIQVGKQTNAAKSDSLHWNNAIFLFEPVDNNDVISLELWYVHSDRKRVSGKVRIDVDKLTPLVPIEEWFLLSGGSVIKKDRTSAAAIRLHFIYTPSSNSEQPTVTVLPVESEAFSTMVVTLSSTSVDNYPAPDEAIAPNEPSDLAKYVQSNFYREPEDWELAILSLEKGEWSEKMGEEAFKKYKKHRRCLPTFPIPMSDSSTSSPVAEPVESGSASERGRNRVSSRTANISIAIPAPGTAMSNNGDNSSRLQKLREMDKKEARKHAIVTNTTSSSGSTPRSKSPSPRDLSPSKEPPGQLRSLALKQAQFSTPQTTPEETRKREKSI